jgi:hypothetical protein
MHQWSWIGTSYMCSLHSGTTTGTRSDAVVVEATYSYRYEETRAHTDG